MFFKKLENGLTVIGINRKSSEVFSIGALVRFGSRHEINADKMGIAHFIEHMNFKGTDEYSQKEIARIIEGNGGDINAYTSRHYTFYHITSLKSEIMESSRILCSMMSKSIIDETEFGKEKEVILEEVSNENDVSENIASNMFYKHIYGSHKLGLPVGGDFNSVSNISIEDIRDTYNDVYNSKNIIFGISGNIDEEKFLMVADLWKSIKTGKETNYEEFNFNELPAGTELSIKKDFTQNYVYLFGRAPSMKDRDLIAARVLNVILGSGTNSRLYQQIRENKGLAYCIYSRASYMLEGGVWIVQCITGAVSKDDPENFKLKKSINEIKNVIRNIRDNGVALNEIESAKKFLLGSVHQCLETSLGELESMLYLYERVKYPSSCKSIIDEISSVTERDIKRVIETYFNIDNWGVFVAGPDSL